MSQGVKFRDIKKQKSSVQDNNSLLNKEITLFGSIDSRWKETFYMQLSIMISSGIDIKKALELIKSSEIKSNRKKVVEIIGDEIVKGKTISEALQQTGEFTAYEYHSVAIGEESNELPFIFESLAEYYQRAVKQRRQIVSALSYPVMILVTSVLAVVFLLVFMVPIFEDIFKRFGGELPAMTRLIIDFSFFFTSNWYFLVLFLLLIFLFNTSQKNKIWYKRRLSGVLMRVPVLGGLLLNFYVHRFCSTLALMVKSRIPLMRAIQLVNNVVEFYPINSKLELVKKKIIGGASLSESLKSVEVFDQRTITMIQIGEETGKLDVFLNRITENLAAQMDHKTSMLNTILEPVLILFLGLVVGVVLITMYLPIFQISTNLNF